MTKAPFVALAMSLVAVPLLPLTGQATDIQRVKALAGCWAVTVGKFTGSQVDSGMTTLPSMIELDTVPGKDFFGKPSGWRALGHSSAGGSRYREGNFTPFGTDSVRISWSSGGFVGLDIEARAAARRIEGVAIAWTDYGGDQRAPITLRRVECR